MELCVEGGGLDPEGRGGVGLFVEVEVGGLAKVAVGALPEAGADPAAAVVRAAEVRGDLGRRGAGAGGGGCVAVYDGLVAVGYDGAGVAVEAVGGDEVAHL